MSMPPVQDVIRCRVCGAVHSLRSDALACPRCAVPASRNADGIFCVAQDVALSYPDDGASLLAEVEDTSFWFRHRNEIIAAVLERFPVDGTIWDVGGGNGYQARMLERAGRSVVLVEPGATGCRNAVARGVSTVVRATLDGLRLPGGSLAAITLFDVIEHLPDPSSLLCEVVRVLRPGGRVFVTVPAYEVLWSDEDDYALHHRRYTRARLEQELSAAGLEVEYSSHFFQSLVAPIALLRALPYRVTRRKGTPRSTDVGEHSPGGVAQRAIEWMLRRELSSIHAGAALRFGASIVAVARVSA